MAEFINIPPMIASEIVKRAQKVQSDARAALRLAIKTVQAHVIDFAPRWTGKLQSSIITREERNGDDQIVTVNEDMQMVAKVHEDNPHAVWSKWPPHQPIRDWVESKLGITDAVVHRAEKSFDRARDKLVQAQEEYHQDSDRIKKAERSLRRANKRLSQSREKGGSKADAIAWAIRKKIKERGLTIPNKEGKGAMFRRTAALAEATKFHWVAFKSAFRAMSAAGG